MEGEREREEERLKEDCGGKACGEGRKKSCLGEPGQGW